MSHTPRPPSSARALPPVLALAAAALAGCSSSPWKSEFVSSGQAVSMAAAPHRGPVRIREVPWDRVQQTLVELQDEWAASDTPPDEWPEDRKAARKARLLKGLQVSADPGTVEVLGRSEFRTTDRLRPDDGELAEFARKVGATSVVWASTYTGKADVIRTEPVTEYRSGSFTPRHDGEFRSRTFSDTSTIFVPVVIQADQRAWVAYFLRERPEALTSGAR